MDYRAAEGKINVIFIPENIAEVPAKFNFPFQALYST